MLTLRIDGMTCPHCASGVREALAAVPGASAVQVDLRAGRATLAGDASDPAFLAALVAAVEEEGYRAVVQA